MAYSYYQNNGAPGWGTQQFVFGQPPAPTFQPQPSWTGYDFYRANAGSPDLSLYNHAWNRVQNMRDYDDAEFGVGLNEARHWHRRLYGGLSDINSMLPSEIGHAAAYEAYRTWLHHRSTLYEPIGGDIERQRESLVGLAIGEASRIMQYSSRSMDHFSRTEASDAAAATAAILFYTSREYDNDDYMRGRSMHGSSVGGYDDPYSYDTNAMYSRHPRSHSRHRSRSAHHRHPLLTGSYSAGIPPSGGIPITGSSHGGMPIPGAAYSNSGSAYGGPPAAYGSYGGGGSSYGSPSNYGGSQYGGVMPGYQQGVAMPMSGGVTPGYGGMSGYPGGPMVVRARSHSMSMPGPYSQPYAQPQYVTAAGGFAGVPAQQPTIIVKHRRHKHSKHKHHRSSRSSERSY